MSTARERALVGSVVERTTRSTPPAPSSRFDTTPGSGFPTAQHRFKSAFARARDEANAKGNVGGTSQIEGPSVVSAKSQARQPVASAAPIVDPKPIPTDADALRRQIHEENARRIAQMSEEEIEEGKRSALEQLGEGTDQLLKRVQEARRRREAKEREAALEQQPAPGKRKSEGDSNDGDVHQTLGRVAPVVSPAPRHVSHGLATRPGVLRVKSLENIGQSVPSPLPATSSTRPSSRTGRKLRFAEVTPDDVHVYESAPRSPKRAVLALPPPPDTKDDSIISLGTFNKRAIPVKRFVPTDGPAQNQPTRAKRDDDELQEGTPEYIRRLYFPGVPANDPSLAWMDSPPPQGAADLSVPRFDLHGAPISASLSASLPSHLGLHHHAEGSHAGYTLDDIFLLSRSTVPAQRASMLGILARIAHRLGLQVRRHDIPEKIIAFAGQEGELRRQILAAGLAAIGQIGSLGAQAAEVVWECSVGWDETWKENEGIELSLAPDVVSMLQLDQFLLQITDVFSHAAVPSKSLVQLLAVVYWLAQQSNKIAEVIINTPRLVPTILTTFLLTPIPPRGESLPPNPLALRLLITLASASRSNASALLDPADALLRFVALLPPSSLYPPVLASTLLTYTLQFYATLASYGLYSHIATTASSTFAALAQYVLSPRPIPTETVNGSGSVHLRTAWTSLMEAWIICATDPHATSPPHEILWTQVCAWGWATDVRMLRETLRNDRLDWAVYASMWDVEAAWLEGARINSVRGGEREREETSQILSGTFATVRGAEFGIVQRALESVKHDLTQWGPTTVQDGKRILESLADAGNVLASALRLFLACLPPVSDDASLSTPPFALPLSELSALSAALVKHPVWSLPSTLGVAHLQVHLRPLTRFIVHFHRVSRYIPGTTPQLWFAQALVFLPLLLPGDESHALAMLDAFSLVTPQFIGIDPLELPQNICVDVLRPFFEYTVRPEEKSYVAPLRPSVESISWSSTLRLPWPLGPQESDDDDSPDAARTHVMLAAGLPLTRDTLFAPLTHLLRSGTSPVFRGGDRLPADWNANEVDVVRATLLLALVARRVLVAHGLEPFAHGPAEIVFACMRTCMLEHGVGAGPADEGEVFRDAAVERLIGWLLEPLTVRGRRAAGVHARTTATAHARSLEDASAPYLLGATPFYQFYTDLVALYGAVSFGHPLFAALVVTPLAMAYAVDYRRALWCGGDGGGSAGQDRGGGAGLGDVVRSVRIPIEDVVCTGVSAAGDESVGVREYLYPIERDAGILGAYVAALVTRDGSGAEGFLKLVAVHHVACTVWEDLSPGEEAEGEDGGAESVKTEETRARLLSAVLARGDTDVVRDVVLYRQRSRGAFLWPPTCYRGEDRDASRGWREARLGFVRRAVGEGAGQRLVGLLLPAT